MDRSITSMSIRSMDGMDSITIEMETIAEEDRVMNDDDDYDEQVVIFKDTFASTSTSTSAASKYSDELERIRGNMEALKQRLQNSSSPLHDYASGNSGVLSRIHSQNPYKNENPILVVSDETGGGEDHKVANDDDEVILFNDTLYAPAPESAASKYSDELERIRGNMEALKQRLQSSNGEVGALYPHSEVMSEDSLSRIFHPDDDNDDDDSILLRPSSTDGGEFINGTSREKNRRAAEEKIANLSEEEQDLSQVQILRAMFLAKQASQSGASEFRTSDKSIDEIDQVDIPSEAVEKKKSPGEILHYRMKLFMAKTIQQTQDSTRQVVTTIRSRVQT